MFDRNQVRDCMTAPVITVKPATSLHAAKQIMLEHNIRHLPVVKNEKLVGVISSGDIRRASPSDATSLSIWEINYLWDQILVESSMATKVITVHADTPILEAARLLLEHRFGCLPVVDAKGQVEGILTEVDVLRFTIKTLEALDPHYADVVDESWATTSP